MATVLLKLLNMVRPSRAYFGEKDAHQFAAMRRMVVDLIGKTRLIDNLWRIPPARWLKQAENIQTGVTHL